MMAEPQIVGLGGAGRSDDETRRLLAHVVGLAGKPSPKVCVVPTARGDEADGVLRLYGLLPQKARASYLPFFPWPPGDLRAFAFAHDGVGVHFLGTELAEVVSVREGATAYRVEPGGESALEARLLD